MAFETSDLYKEAINKLSKTTFISGTLETESGTVVEINNETIDQGSFYVTNQCVNSDAFTYGSVFTAEAGITLRTEVDRYSLYNAKIKLFFNILLSNNEYETIPLGEFFVNEPNRVGKNITIKAYDGMTKLDDKLDESTTGTVYEILLFIADRCGIELAQTEEEILKLINTTTLLSVSSERIVTFRDLLSYICQITCTFAVFDRYGKLKLCEFATEITKRIDSKLRTSSKFSDFETYFSAIIAHFLVSSEYKPYSHVSETVIGGLVYDAGNIPLIQGFDEYNQPVIDNMFTKISQVRYVPCEISFSGDPSLDLGDMIENEDRFGNKIVSLVTYYKWSYRNGHKIKSAGSNPKLASMKEKNEQSLANIKAEINSKTVAVYSYSNARPFTVKGGEEDIKDQAEVVRIAFAANETTTALFMATIHFNMDMDGFVELNAYLDSVFYEDSTVAQYCLKGDNIITIMNYIPVEKNKQYKYSVMAKTYCKETDLRINEAKIKTNENARDATIQAYQEIVLALSNGTELPITELSETIQYDVVEPSKEIPTMKIEKYHVKGAIFGQGLAGQLNWDGTLTFDEMFGNIAITQLGVKAFNDELSVNKFVHSITSISEQFGIIPTNSPLVLGFAESITFDEVVTNYTFETEKANIYSFDRDAFIFESEFKLKTEDVVEGGNEIPVDSGKAVTLAIDKSKYLSVSDIRIEVV